MAMFRRVKATALRAIPCCPYAACGFPSSNQIHNESIARGRGSPPTTFAANKQQRLHFEQFVSDRSKSTTLVLEEALGLFYYSIQMRRTRPSAATFDQLLEAMSRMKHYSTVVCLSKVMNFFGIRPSIFTLNILTDCCCNLGRVDLGFCVLGSFFKLGFQPDDAAFTTLIKGAVFMDIHNEEEDGIREELFLAKLADPYPSLIFDALVEGANALCNRTWKKEAALDALDQVEDPYILTSASLIHACSRVTWKHMIPIGLQLHVDMVPVHFLIDALCQSGMVDEAHQFLQTHTTTHLSTHTYNLLIRGYCSQGRVEVVDGIYDSMRAAALPKPTTATWNILIDGYCKAGKMDEALSAVLCFSVWGFTADASTFTTIITETSKLGNVSLAEEAIHCKAPSLEIFDYTNFAKALCANNSSTQFGKHLFILIIKNGLEADSEIYSFAMDSLCKEGKLNEARDIFCSVLAKGLQPNTRMYNMRLSCCYKEGMLTEAQVLLKDMKEKGIPVDESMLNVIVHGCLAHHKHVYRSVTSIWDMVKADCCLDEETASKIYYETEVLNIMDLYNEFYNYCM